MSGPSIVVRVLGDFKALGANMDTVATKAQSTAQKAHSAFSGFIGGLNQTGIFGPFQQQIGMVDDAIGTLLDHSKGIGETMVGVGGAITGVGAVLSAFGSKEQASHQQLQAAIQATGKNYDDYSQRIEGAVKSQERYGNTADKTQDALKQLTQATNDPAKALQLLATASDLAASRHESLSTAAGQLGKAYNGSTRIFKAYGIEVTKSADTTKELTTATNIHNKAVLSQQAAQANLTAATAAYNAQPTAANAKAMKTAQDKLVAANINAYTSTVNLNKAHDDAKNKVNKNADAVAKLGDKLQGQAAAGANTFMGRLDAMKAKVEDSISQFGQKYGPALQLAGVGIMALGTMWQIAGPMISTGGAEAGAGEAAALWPIALIVLGVAALIVAIYELWKNWNTVWGFIKAVAMDVWNWIATNWPLLLTILFGPIGLAAALIIKNFADIKRWAADAVGYVIAVWNGIYGFFAGLVGAVGGFFARMWGDISGGAAAAVRGVVSAWNGVVSFFSGIGSAIGGAAAHMWDGLLSSFKGVINGIASVWNRTVGSLHFSIPGWVPGIGGDGFNAPTIPSLAQGGLITSTGFIFAHAGEAISPIPGNVGGPAVVINEATFSTELDVDSFMRSVAWHARTAAL